MDIGDTGTPMLSHWEVPSHTAVGAGLLAGSIGGLEDLPADMTLKGARRINYFGN